MNPTGSSRSQEELFLNSPGQSPAESPIIGPLRINKRESPSPAPQSSVPLPYPDDRPNPVRSSGSSGSSPTAQVGKQSASPTSSGSGVSPVDYPPALRPRDGREPKQSTLAERRGNAPKPLPESPAVDAPYPEFNQHYYPPPQPSSSRPGSRPTAASQTLQAPAHSINRISSIASTSTTRAQRGSPPPPETPIVEPGQHPASDIEARYAASGIAGTSTLSGLQAQSAAAQRRAEQYAGQQPRNPIQRPWTPTELPGSQPHGPPTVYQGAEVISAEPQQPAAALPPHPATTIPSQTPPHPQQPARIPNNALEQDLERMRISSSPPPAYSSVPRPASAAQGYPNEKQRLPATSNQPAPAVGSHPATAGAMNGAAAGVAGAAVGAAVAPAVAPPMVSAQDHPAFANDPIQQQQQQQQQQKQKQQQEEQQQLQQKQLLLQQQQMQQQQQYQLQQQQQQQLQLQQFQLLQQQQQQQQQPQLAPVLSPHNEMYNGAQYEQHPALQQQAQINTLPTPSIPPASPPPLPEGWIAHLDPNSGQYYYIHLPTQSTQWEFPKGPTPLNLNEAPMSPVGSVYSSHPLASPGLSAFGKPLASPGIPMTPGYESLQSPIVTGFSGPPPSSGVDLYKIVPTNGVYFGPYLRYANMDIQRGIWFGSILLVTDAAQPPTIHIHQSVDLSPNPRQLKAMAISTHQRWTFYKYEIDVQMDETGPAKWTYAITSHLGCTRYEFLVAGRYETSWRFITTSGNDFSLNVNENERARLGGVGLLWKDIMQKHNEIGGFHAQLCLGGQIYADRMWKEIPSLKQWLAIRGKDARKSTPWTTAHEQDVSHGYFHYYTSHFDQPYLRESFAQI
ncbi:hypothetical protein AOCH_002224, partial [Aspergillus ochraceoroseus]